MSFWKDLFGKRKAHATPSIESQPKQPFTADAYWDRAIAAADAGRDSESQESFERAIEMKPDYYISVIEPSSPRAKVCWQRAVDRYVRQKDAAAETKTTDARENHCDVCGKDLGTQWHYRGIEHVLLTATVGAQCPDCGRTVCDRHLTTGQDGKYEPCPNCGVRLQVMSEGPASSSMVEQARSQRRYRGAIKEPSKLGRPVERG